jgi:hypothetical protein
MSQLGAANVRDIRILAAAYSISIPLQCALTTKGVARMSNIIKRAVVGFLAALGMMGISAPAAFASSPHFINASASFGSGDALIVQFKEAGLGDNQNIYYVASADATAEYDCVNGGGKHPQATNKESAEGPVTASGTFSSGKNGAINGSLTLHAPSAGDFSCPPGQRLVLANVSYTNVAITDTTNGVSESIGGTFARTFFVF